MVIPDPDRDQQKLRVLLLEDNQTFAYAIQELLSFIFHIEAVPTVQECLEKLASPLNKLKPNKEKVVSLVEQLKKTAEKMDGILTNLGKG